MPKKSKKKAAPKKKTAEKKSAKPKKATPKKQEAPVEEEVVMIEDDLDETESEKPIDKVEEAENIDDVLEAELDEEAEETVEEVLEEESEEPESDEGENEDIVQASELEEADEEDEETGEQDVENGLEAIYGSEKGDLSKVERKHTKLTSILLTVVITLAVVAALAWGAFFVYQNYIADNTEEQFNLEIDVPEELTSGDMTTVTINYQNPTNVPIADLQLDVNLPTAFHMNQADPAPSDVEELVWEVGALGAGSDNTITIEGVWIAEVPSSTPIQVFANYRPSNFNADFQDISTVYVNTIASALETTFEGAEEGRPGENLSYSFTITNTGAEAMEQVEASLELPNGFFLESSDPVLDPGEAALWTFETLEPEEEITVTLEGTFAADTEGFQYFTLETRIEDENRSLIQNSVEGFTDVVGDNLSIQLVANGSTDDVTAELDGILRVSLALENTGETELDDVSLLLDFQADESIPLLWNDSELDGGAITSDGILWNTAAIGTLAPGDKTILNLTFPIRDSLSQNHADIFDVLAAASIGDFTIKSTPVKVSISTEADFAAEARYYTKNGAPLGSGPLPPRVGSKTVYRIFWNIDNELHDLNNIQVEATLPPHVNWENQFDVDLGDLSYDSGSRTITWTVSEMPTSLTHIDATFAISISPDPDDVGTFIKLISGSTMTAKDAVTNISITNTTDSLTTELPNDEYADGKGVAELPL